MIPTMSSMNCVPYENLTPQQLVENLLANLLPTKCMYSTSYTFAQTFSDSGKILHSSSVLEDLDKNSKTLTVENTNLFVFWFLCRAINCTESIEAKGTMLFEVTNTHSLVLSGIVVPSHLSIVKA